jgi:parvulin-like peptidyl-prolyl isomerase
MRAALLVVAVLACLAFASAKVTAKVNKQVANFKASTKSQKAHVGGSEISSVRNDKKVLHKAFAQNGVKNVKTKALLVCVV